MVEQYYCSQHKADQYGLHQLDCHYCFFDRYIIQVLGCNDGKKREYNIKVMGQLKIRSRKQDKGEQRAAKAIPFLHPGVLRAFADKPVHCRNQDQRPWQESPQKGMQKKERAPRTSNRPYIEQAPELAVPKEKANA